MYAIVAALFILGSASSSFAETVTSTGDGNWNSTTPDAPWPGGLIPSWGDDVIIAPGHDITVTTHTVINSITFSIGATRTFTISSGATLLVRGGITVQNATVATNTAVTIAGTGTINCSSFTVGGTANTPTADSTSILTFTNANLSISGNLLIDGEHAATFDNDASFLLQSGTVTVGGTVTLTSEDDGTAGSGDATLNLDSGAETGTLNVSGGTPFSLTGAGSETTDFNGTSVTVIYSGNVAQTILDTTYTNLTLSGNSTKTLAAALTVENTITVSAGTTLDMTTITMTIDDGTLVVNGTVDFTTTTGKIQEANGTAVLTMGANGLIRTVDALGLGPVGNASLEDTWTLTTLDTNGTIEYYNGAAQTVTDRNYNNLIITNAGTKTFTKGAARTLNGSLTINTGAPFTLAGANALNVLGTWTNNGTFTHSAGSVAFNGSTNQTIGGTSANTFLTLTIANTGTGNEVVSLTSAALTTVSTALNVSDGTFDMGASSDLTTNTVTVAAAGTFRNFGTGDLTLSGNLANAGAVRFSANGSPCGDADDILIRSSVGGTQRNWTGAGTFALSDVNVQDQAGTAVIAVQSGTNNGNNGINWTFVACLSNTYTWNGGVLGSWIVAANWTPTRTVPAVNDVLVIDGTATPAPTITNVPTEEIAALRMINGADPNLQAGAANNTLTMSGRTGTDLSVPSGSVLTLSTANALILNIASGSTADVSGHIIFQDAAHRLLGNAASGILFHSGADFTTTTGFTGNAFGSGGGGLNGTTGSVQFESGSQYFHGAGDSPFGSAASAAVAVFQTGSEADWLTSTGFQASGRTYATLVIGNASTAVDVTDSGSGDFQFTNLVINSSGSDDSSLTFTGSGASTINILGNITSANTGLGGTLADVTLTAGTGGIQINNGATSTFGTVGNSRSIFFGSNATVGTGTTLNLGRLVQMGLTADGVVIADGTITPNSGAPGYIIGAVRKPVVPAGSFTFPLGKVTGYTPVDFSNATGTADVTIRAVNGTVTPVSDATSLDEYWAITLNSGSLTTDIQFTYLDADVDGNEADYKVIRVEFGAALNFNATTMNTAANTATVTDVDHFSDWTLGEPVGPSAVKLARFNAARFSDGVELTWESGYEVDNLGYHIYREQNGKRTLITPGIVAGSALRVGPGSRLTAGYTYSWFDPAGAPDAVYHLESIDLNGDSEMVGPINPYAGNSERRSRRARAKLLNELVTANSSDESLARWPAEMASKDGADLQSSNDAVLTQQAIAGGNAVKIQVRKNGWYRITQAELVAAGFDPSTDARMLQLYVDGQEVPISLSTEGARLNSTDTLEFYGVPLDTLTTDTRTYWLVKGDEPGQRMIARRGKVKPSDVEVDSALRSFNLTVERREKLIYFSNLLNGEAENIFGPAVFSSTAVNQLLPINNLDTVSAAQPELEVALQGLTDGNHVVGVKLNGTDIGTVNFSGRQHPVKKFPINLALLRNGDNVLALQSANGGGDISLIDSVRLTYPHLYKADNNSLRFTVIGGQPVRVEGFSSPNVRVIDVTNPYSPTQHSALSSFQNGAYAATIQVPGSGFRTLIAFTDNLSEHPVTLTPNAPSSLSTSTSGADMLIVTHKDFRQAVEPLAALRRNQGLVVSVIDVEDVYDEFSFGAHTPDALKSFLSTAATTWLRKPKYVLLVGDSSWDPRDYLKQGQNDFVPTKLIDTANQETSSDDWFADFQGFGLPSMAIGRLPGRTSAQITLMIGKIMSYEQERELNAPLRGAVLVADNGFETRNAETGGLLPGNMAVQSINRSQVGNDDLMRGQVVDALNAGPTLVNYYGHGSVGVWTGAGLLDNDLATNLTNSQRLSLYVMMTCLNGYASDAYVDSLGESALKAPHGGAVAVWASSGFTVPEPQFALSSEFYRLLFSGQPVRLGEATRGAKAATTDLDVRRTWTLLGDPAMRIR